MSGSTFRQLLSQTTDAVERPKALPTGHYVGIIKTHEFGTSRNKQTPYIRFLLGITDPTSDVDSAELDGIDLSRRELRKDYYITPGALYRLADMLDATLGREEGHSFDERIPQTTGMQVVFGVVQRDSEDGTEKYNDVTTIVAAE
jgi:hypothetical protein